MSDGTDDTEWRADLMWAIEDNQPDQVAILAPGHDLDFVDENSGLTPLMAAVDAVADGSNQRGGPRELKLVQILLSCGASPTAKGQSGEDATDVARQYVWHEAIDAMRAVDPDGVPRLFWPLGYVNRIRMPVAHDEDTPWRVELMDAIKRSDVERVRSLLAGPEGSLDFVHPGSTLTPLELAVGEQRRAHEYGRPRDATIVQLLLGAGATPDFPSGA